MTGLEILAGVAAVTALAGGVMGAMGASQQAAAAAAAGEHNAAMMEQQAKDAEGRRKFALDQAAQEAKDQAMKNRAMNGSIRAAYGMSGVAMEGSPLDVLQATAIEEELDIDKILYKGDLQGLEWTEKAQTFRSQAQLYRMGASSARTAGEFGVATNLLAGISGAAKSFTPGAGRFPGSGAAAP